MFEKIIDVRVISGYVVRAMFADGSVMDCDLGPEIETKPYYAALRNPDLFRRVHPIGRGSAIAWTDEIDMASEWVWDHGGEITV